MIKRNLTENWTLTVLGNNPYGIPQTPVQTRVPSSVYSTLLEQGLMSDPFWRDNETDALRLMDCDFCYETAVRLTLEERSCRRLILRFEGIDTLAEVSVNGRPAGKCNDMHRPWEFDITSSQSSGECRISVLLRSPTRYIAEADRACPVGASTDALPGYPHLRKAACMFGWDWGPRLPDAGLCRPVTLLACGAARIAETAFHQEHEANGSLVRLSVRSKAELLQSSSPHVRMTLTAPNGTILAAKEAALCADPLGPRPYDGRTGLGENRCVGFEACFTIENPLLWWPNGYGAQPLYTLQTELFDEAGILLDSQSQRVGLRSLEVRTEPLPAEKRDPHMEAQSPDFQDGRIVVRRTDGDTLLSVSRNDQPLEGRNFAFTVNGLPIFAMGANYIPEDSLLTRQSRDRTRMLITSAAEAHMNMIRVWGGGIYPDDDFFDLCDELGLLVWQDLPFSCASYELSEPFLTTLEDEFRLVARRLRHHASLALWCGNNEMETQYESYDWPQSQKQVYDYIRLFEMFIPKILREEDPERFYWPSSPSSGGNFENSQAENRGDSHYWGVWHGGEPFTAFRKHHFRFLSEFGFQSFPAEATIRRFTLPEDRNIFSRIMEMHQRNTAANGKIMNYLSQTYLYPKDFSSLVYCSQLLQASAIRYGIEHFRRFRGICMGTLVWQLDDCWPVASWSSIDYYGNWKALHYAEKRSFAPVLLSCCEHGEIDQKPYPNTAPKPVDYSADLHVANETSRVFRGTVCWAFRRPDSSVLREGAFPCEVQPYSGQWLPRLDANDIDPLRIHLSYALLDESGKTVSAGAALFCAPKHYAFMDPQLSLRHEGDSVTVSSHGFAMAVSVETAEGVLRLSDCFFDMEAGEKTVQILPCRDFTGVQPSGTLSVRSLWDASH